MANNLVVQLLLKTGTFSTDLKQAKGQIQNFQKGCQNAGKSLDAFGKGLGINVGALSKFAPAASAAAAAGKVLRDSFKNNTDAMDAFNREAEVVKSTYRSLTTQLFKNGSMSMDFKGIAEQAREYYDAIDKAGVANVAITNELKLQQVEYDRLYATAMDVSLSEVDRLEALNEASRVMEHQITLKRQMAQFDRQAAKEGLENGLVSSGINKYWLENEGQKMLKELLQFDSENGQYMFDTYFGSVNPNNARTGVIGNSGAYGRAIEKMKTSGGAKSVEREALEKGYKSVNEYLDALRKEETQATDVINSTRYQLAQALHNMRGSSQGYEQISKYILLYLNDFGIQQIDAEAQNTRSMIERLRKRITGKEGTTPNYSEGSIGFLEKELTKLNEQWKSALDQNTRDTLLAQIDATQATIDVMSGKNKGTVLSEGSQKWLASEITKIEDEISSLDLGLPDSQPLLQKMNDWEESWEEFVDSLNEEERKLFDKFAENMKRRWDLMNIKAGYDVALSSAQGNKTPKQDVPNNKVNYLEGSYGYKKEELNKRIEDIRKTLTEGVGLSDEDIKKKISELRSLEKEVSDLETKFGFRDAITQSTSTWDNFNQTMANTATIVSSLSNTFKEGADVTAASVLQMVASCLPAVGSLITSIQALTTAEAIEAGVAATGKAVSTSKHWIEAIAAVAALGAAVASAIAAASKPNIQRFANGGIVGGNSFTGDRVVANVNSGEMILNKSQQANLFKLANGGMGSGKEVEFHISGTELVGVLNNVNRKNRVIR